MPHNNQSLDESYVDTQSLCKVRTITLFLSLDRDQQQWREMIFTAASACNELFRALHDDGYEVQTIRIVTNPFGEYLDTSTIASAREGLALIRQYLDEAPVGEAPISPAQSPADAGGDKRLRLRFAIGEARSAKELALLPELIAEFGDLCNACVNIGIDSHGILDNPLITSAATVVQRISQLTPRGEGNFNFTVNFNCEPLIPYFPAGYYRKELGPCFVIGLETPDLLVDVLKRYNRGAMDADHNERHASYYTVMRDALQYHLSRLQGLVEPVAKDGAFRFAGFDSSAAPSKECASMADVYQQMGVDYFGAAGTVEISALLTRVFKSMNDVELTGFSGLMLALTEDTGLASGSKRQEFDIRSLLTYSAVCGIGLDTVPIPGDTPVEKIAALMRDTGTMAFRLNKPLTVRLFPVPGLRAGDITAFTSDDLCNCAVLAVP